MTEPRTAPSPSPDLRTDAGTRSMAIDALRGFNMLPIIGLNTIVYKVHELFPGPVTALVDRQFRHPA